MEVPCNRWLRLVVAMGQSRSCKVANSDSCTRGIFSTSTKADNHARVEAARSYLDAWVGNGSNKGGKTNASSHKPPIRLLLRQQHYVIELYHQC